MSAAQVGEKIAKENGHKFGYGAMLINSILEREGFQVVSESFDATGQQILRWKLTELGERYGETINRTSNGKAFYAIRWFSSIVPILQRYFPKKYD